MKTTKEKIEIMKAFDEGKKIECIALGWEEWRQVSDPIWDWAKHDYRIKSEISGAERKRREFIENYYYTINKQGLEYRSSNGIWDKLTNPNHIIIFNWNDFDYRIAEDKHIPTHEELCSDMVGPQWRKVVRNNGKIHWVKGNPTRCWIGASGEWIYEWDNHSYFTAEEIANMKIVEIPE